MVVDERKPQISHPSPPTFRLLQLAVSKPRDPWKRVSALPAKKWKNPFYTLLLPVGAAFCITGFAYGLMAFQAVNAGRAVVEQSADHPLFQWLRSYGTTAMVVELVLLAVLTVGAIATDEWWMEDEQEARSEECES